MASPPPMPQPLAARSPDKANVNLRHPIPDLQSLQGAYVGNIERLEEHAERMSESGSDLGEEIRKLHTELKRSDSRDEATRHTSNRSRNVSISSHANSIVDVNGAARWGGYSPGGYVTSPVGSLRSNSWSNPSVPVNRQRSESKASRLGQVVHPNEIDERTNFTMSPGSPESLRSAPLAIHTSDSPPPQPARKVSSFTQKYEDIANELRDELRNSVILDPPMHHGDEQHSEEYRRYATRDDYPDRPPTAASTDTSRQARMEWQDFDGVHCPDTVPEEDDDHSRHSSFSNSMLRLNDYTTAGAPPPDDGMVFYPAPVPRLLNLPKRLSQLPASNVQARRRTQLLDSMQAENRKSAPMLGEMTADAPSPARNNRKSMLNLPPQLRASAYFDNQAAPSQEFAVQGESAQDTLESILNASARAPVSAFTDHPFSGHVGPEVYGPEQKRKSTARLPEVPPTLAETRRRSSFNMLDTKRNSSGDPLNKLRKRNSSADMNLLIVKASEQRMSLGDQLDDVYEDDRGPEFNDGQDPARHSIHDVEGRNPDDVYDEEHQNDEEPGPEEVEEEPQYFGAPTTLLAELQMRKAKQKTRNMNYATLVEQGNMPTHRTLLELDDIAEKEKQKRLKKKVNLAWEAQGEDDDSDDDVPLAVLYKQPQQQREMDRPLGLIARRELEDKEPLSYRRARLRGESPNRRGLRQTPSQMHLAPPTTITPGPETDEEEGETLGERMRRLREKKELDEALGNDIRKSTISLDFASEMMSKFGVSDEPKDASQPAPSPGVEEEETLGQRRARLQAEAAARGDAPADTTRPGLRPRMSMADVLSANPIDVHNQARKVSDQQLISHLPPGSLLQQNVVAEERRKAERMNQNMRASSFGSYDPLVGTQTRKNDDDQPLALKIQAYKNRMAGIPDQRAQSMMFNNGLATPNPAMNMNMGPNMNDGRQSMMMGMNSMGMMSQPNLGMMPMMGMSQQNLGMMGMQPQMGMQGMQGMQPQMGGMHAPSMMGMPMGGMPMNMMGMMMQPPMDPRQRDQIDRWMQNVQH